jgi:predicted ATPase
MSDEEFGRAREEAAAVRTRLRPPTNLPSPPTPLVGRERELAELAELLLREDVRLLCLTGPPGTGKTRLALALGLELLEEFSDGVFFVELAPLVDPALVTPTIAQTLGVQESGAQPLLERLNEHLADKHILLIVDNFEHLLEAGPALSELLATASSLKAVATSRERLHLSAEHDFPLAPLAEEEAVELFAQRAHAVQPDFDLDGNRALVGEICRHLDGLPLALELAAARVKVLSPESLLTRLEQRLPLLTSSVRDAPERQRTMRATIEWSHELLASAEQQLLARLAVFTGGCTLEAAEQVCAADLDTLATLVDDSLLYQSHDRFAMLETIREYALGQLEDSGMADDVRRRHAEFYLALCERAHPKLTQQKREQVAALELLAAEHENLRAALTWALDRDPEETALRLGASLSRYFVFRSVTEGRQWLTEVLERGGTAARVERAEVLAGAGLLAQAQGAYAKARTLYEDGLRIRRDLGDARGVADSLHNLGWLALHQGEYEQAGSLLEESLSLWRSRTKEPVRISSLNILGIVALYQADNARAESLFLECLAIARDRGDQVGLATAINNLSLVSIFRDDFEQAVSQAEESLRLFRELAWPEGVADSLDNLGRAAVGLGDYGRARELFVESLQLSSKVNDKWGIAECLEGLAGVASASAADERAARLYGVAASLRETIGAITPPVDRADHERRAARSQERLGAEAWRAAYEEGKSLTLEQAIETALDDGSGASRGL